MSIRYCKLRGEGGVPWGESGVPWGEGRVPWKLGAVEDPISSQTLESRMEPLRKVLLLCQWGGSERPIRPLNHLSSRSLKFYSEISVIK